MKSAVLRSVVCFCSTVCLLTLFGCSGDSGQTIEGKVSYSDGAPLGVGAVVLSNAKNSYSAGIKSDGTYMLENVLSGDYNVGISGALTGGTKAAEGEMNYDADGNYIEPPAAEPATSLIRESMADPSMSGLTMKVPGTYTITVERP